MALYTRFGDEVFITDVDTTHEQVQIRYKDDGTLAGNGEWHHKYILKADGGINEIDEAVMQWLKKEGVAT